MSDKVKQPLEEIEEVKKALQPLGYEIYAFDYASNGVSGITLRINSPIVPFDFDPRPPDRRDT